VEIHHLELSNKISNSSLGLRDGYLGWKSLTTSNFRAGAHGLITGIGASVFLYVKLLVSASKEKPHLTRRYISTTKLVSAAFTIGRRSISATRM
jgi:hypothetical protein